MGCISSQNKELPPISLLDNDVLLLIFTYLNLRERCRLARVCRKWRNLSKQCNSLWRELDLVSYEVNLVQKWPGLKLKFTAALKCLRIGAREYKSINCGITKGVLKDIANTCPNLKDLEICGCLLGGIDASDLPMSLKRLIIFKCCIRDESWFTKAIQSGNLSKLKHVDFDFFSYKLKQVSNQFARDLMKCIQHVKSLSLRNLVVSDLQLQDLPLSVKELCLLQCTLPRRWFDISVTDAKHAPQVTKLTIEVLRHNSWTTLCSIGCIAGLVELHIYGADLRALSSANLPSRLQKLVLRQVWMPKRWFRASAIAGNLQQLKYLELTKLRSFSQTCASDFRALPNLKYLHVCKSYIDDMGMAYAVGHLLMLECLTITNGCMTDVSLSLLGEYLSNLKQLRLRHCSLITDVGIQCLEDLKGTLKLLEIEDCKQITSDGVVKLASNLRGSLRNMNVTSDILGVDYCEVFLATYDMHLHVTSPPTKSSGYNGMRM